MSNNSPDTQKRRYDSSRRARQAARPVRKSFAATIATFSESGWAGTTVATLAARGGVAVETIYSGFGPKKGLLRAAMDAAVVGDTDDVPFVERPEFSQLGEGPTEDRIRAMVTVVTDIRTPEVGAGLESARRSGAIRHRDRRLATRARVEPAH